ncbi:AraC family transcriptional regulator [Brevibacillus borstelensis]|uniref:AraC family transcriptional regulator n=1 Tax=Brevibacillus TaxID=55080 RepID=UPI002E1F3661|nr:AraC family transcriptional regulator [Brevibacillus borstelensis]
MDHYERIQCAIEFIEKHLQEEVNIADIAAEACFSAFHFQRLFQAISGFSVHEYIRKRRLSEAAVLLKQTQTSILDLAIACQYGSQEAFTRAFEATFGITPAKFRKANIPISLQKKLDFLDDQKRAKGEISMNKPNIVQLNSIAIVGYAYKTNLNNESYFEDIPRFYADFGRNGHYMRIPNKAAPDMAYGISCDFQDNGDFTFIVGEEVKNLDGELEDGFVHCLLPAGKYAEFRVIDSVQNTRTYIYGTWLPNSNYERREGPDFEITDVRQSVYPDQMKIKIYIPID